MSDPPGPADPTVATAPAVPDGRLAAETVRRLAASIPDNDRAFAASVLRTRSVAAREVLAWLASDGALGDRQLRELGQRLRVKAFADQADPVLLPSTVDPKRLASYAHTLGVQLGSPEDRSAALGLLHAVARSGHALTPREAQTYAQLLLADGRGDDALEAGHTTAARTVVGGQIAADRLNPALSPGSDVAVWLAALNTCLIRPGLAPLALREDGGTPFDRLVGAGVHPGGVHGPLICVVMSAYNPDLTLLTAVRSLIDQTYADWELLIVDDASPAKDLGVLAAAEALDTRVRVIRKAVNGGTYRARNTALRQTNAEFFTCLDSDDWAHPQRLELGIAPLLADRQVMASRSMCVRADDDLLLSRVGHHSLIVNAPSLLVRMHPGVSRVGFFDTVRKAADTEYAVRLEAAFGVPVLTLDQDVLTMARHQSGSLSFGEFMPGWRHEARNAYRQAYASWHNAIRRGGDAFLDPDQPRRFPAPRRWQAPLDARLDATRALDVVLFADLRADALGATEVAATARACSEVGLSVGFLHAENLWAYAAKEAPLDSSVQELIDTWVVERIFLEDEVCAESVIVPDPALLQFPPWVSRPLQSRRVLVARTAGESDPDAEPAAPPVSRSADGTGAAPSTAGGTGRFDVGTVARHSEDLFGAVPTWVPADRLAGTGIAQDLSRARSLRPIESEQAAADCAVGPALPGLTGASRTWLTIRRRRPGDGESADVLALRHTSGAEGTAAALRALRAALPAIEQPGPLERATVASLITPHVDSVAQNVSGVVSRYPDDLR